MNIPVVKIVLGDAEGRTAAALHEAMRDALASGLDGVEMRCWINFEPGWEKGAVIYGKVTGAQIWSELHTDTLPAWAKPIGTIELSTYPDPRLLRAAPPKR